MREACVVSAKNTETATINPTPALPHGGGGRSAVFCVSVPESTPKTLCRRLWRKQKSEHPTESPPPPVGEGGVGLAVAVSLPNSPPKQIQTKTQPNIPDTNKETSS